MTCSVSIKGICSELSEWKGITENIGFYIDFSYISTSRNASYTLVLMSCKNTSDCILGGFPS